MTNRLEIKTNSAAHLPQDKNLGTFAGDIYFLRQSLTWTGDGP
jgi:hypothetical protein